MYFGVDYHPEQWVYPYGGTNEKPEAEWERDIELMQTAGINVVRIGEFTWGLCEPEEGKYAFGWMKRVMDLLGKAGIKTVLATPTAAPPVWLARKHPEILPIDERGLTKHEGTRRAVCLNSDVFWNHSKLIVEQMAKTLGQHPHLIAWQIDNGLGGNFTEASFNEDTRHDWHAWLEAKYETIERLNQCMGLRHWGQVVSNWDQVPMPMAAPTVHNPALVLDWCRFCSDTIVQFARMQADLLHELTPQRPVTTNLRALLHRFDHFDLAEVIDFVSIESTAALKAKSAELACEIDMLRSLKKTGIRTPDGDTGFWVMEQIDQAGPLATTYLAFLAAALQRPSRRFRNFMDHSRLWLEEEGSEESHSRALWALGTGAARSKDEGRRRLAVQLFDHALSPVTAFSSPRAWAFALLGLHEYLSVYHDNAPASEIREKLTGLLVGLWKVGSSEDWPWFEGQVTYENARLPQALIQAGRSIPHPEALEIGLKSLGWLISIQKTQAGNFRPIGNDGFYVRGGARADFDQQPVEAQAMVSGCLEAFHATGDVVWFAEARRAFEWFLGRNDTGIALYDPVTGGCSDGLHVDRINENQGAESSLAFLLSLAEMKAGSP